MAAETLTVEQKQEIFHALVEAQDATSSVSRSHQIISEKFNISVDQVRAIENEGIENEWPPLG